MADGGARAAERTAARILLVRACEECDPEARFVALREREAASKAAREAHAGHPAALVAARAERLAESLETRFAALRTARRLARPPLPALPVLFATGVFGLAADALGSGHRVNLLAFPLLALFAWNLAVYALLALAPLLARGARGSRLGALFARAATFVAERRARAAQPSEARWLAASLRRFGALWWRSAGALYAERAELLLHVGALGFALGIVGGMYFRGLVFEYRASWESTFLGSAEVAALLGVVLGPAAHLLDALSGEARFVPLLGPEALAALRAPGDGPAAPWIHLWALSAVGIIGLPRAALAARAARRARGHAARLAPPLDEPYFLRLLSAERGEGLRIELLPYSHRLSPRTADAVQELLRDLFGSRAHLETKDSLPYGAEPPGAAEAGGVRVVVFNLAQSPEHEVHGAFLEGLRSAAPATILVLLDEEPYRARLGPGADERLAQRVRAWQRTARESGLRTALVPAAGAADALADARAALLPADPEAAR